MSPPVSGIHGSAVGLKERSSKLNLCFIGDCHKKSIGSSGIVVAKNNPQHILNANYSSKLTANASFIKGYNSAIFNHIKLKFIVAVTKNNGKTLPLWDLLS